MPTATVANISKPAATAKNTSAVAPTRPLHRSGNGRLNHTLFRGFSGGTSKQAHVIAMGYS